MVFRLSFVWRASLKKALTVLEERGAGVTVGGTGVFSGVTGFGVGVAGTDVGVFSGVAVARIGVDVPVGASDVEGAVDEDSSGVEVVYGVFIEAWVEVGAVFGVDVTDGMEVVAVGVAGSSVGVARSPTVLTIRAIMTERMITPPAARRMVGGDRLA